ncbi:MAG: hypothetical protein O7D93_01220 [Acidobacteria bacterium]|nr:hypothetical protein [Acidobacteriota bacterium]MCZ6878904.1 hypothetical protein [Acidobacteriota bacterium]
MIQHASKQTSLLSIFWAAVICALFSTSLFAHVAIFPQTIAAGTRHHNFYIRAPVEKDIPVVEMGFEVDARWLENRGSFDFQHIEGWDLHVELNENERVNKAWWTTTGEGALPGTFQLIFMRVNVPSTPGVYNFIAWQKYSDGSEVWWNEVRGEEGVRTPWANVTVEAEPLFGAGPLEMSVAGFAFLALALSLYALFTVRKLLATGNHGADS